MNLTRREFGATAGWGTAATLLFPGLLRSRNPSLRVIAYNILACTGFPADRALAKQAVKLGQMPQRLAMELLLYQPDIVTFSESPDEQLTREIARLLEMHHVRFASGSFPGTLLSRFEIIESRDVPREDVRPRELFTRHWGVATLRLDNGEPLIVHSAHLHPGTDPAIRRKEIPVMIEWMKDDLAAGKSMLLMGDLNHGPDTDEYRMWTDAGWIDTFAAVGEGDGFTIRSDEPRLRIDYVLAAGPIAATCTESRPLFAGNFRVDLEDNESFALSDHLPQLAAFGPP